MWGKRKGRCARLPRQLALGLLEDAMGRVERQQEAGEGEPDAVRYPGAVPPAAPADPHGLRAAGIPVDNSAGPEPPPAADSSAADDPDPVTPPQGQLSARRTRESTRHDTFGLKNSLQAGICSRPSAIYQLDGAHWREGFPTPDLLFPQDHPLFPQDHPLFPPSPPEA